MRRSVPILLGMFGASAPAMGELVYGVTSTQTLVTFDSASPNALLTGVPVSGLQTNETVRSIDFRPATGELFALGSFSNLYTVDPATGMATQVGAGSFSSALNGSSFGFDFNPTIDRIRVVSDADQNLVLNPNDGTSTMVTSLFYGAGDANEGVNPNVVGSAYTNSFAGSTSTQLYGIDTGLDILVTQANSAGTLGTVGALGADLNDVLGFDISGATGIAYAAARLDGTPQTSFWTIDLATGAAMMIGNVGGGSTLTSIAVVPAPSALGVLAAGLGLGAVRRRRAAEG